MVFQVFVKYNGRVVAAIHLCDTEEQFESLTVQQLKEKIIKTGFYSNDDAYRLVFAGWDLRIDSRRLCEYGVQDLSTITVIHSLFGGGEDPGRGDGGMGDKDGKNRSMEKLSDF